MKAGELSRLEETLGHRFANPDLAVRALTHASAVDGPGGEQETYQRLEFLGDRVLGLVIADMLIERFPDAAEGELSRVFHRLVSGETCALVGQELDLGSFVRAGKSLRGARMLPSVLGDVCEALIGALYSDGGLAAARAVIVRFWEPRIQATMDARRDPKTELQEWAHRRGFGTPAYSEVLRSGPDHAPEFEIEVSVGGLATERGKGGSKREAEHDAAGNLLRREGVWGKG